eukprot:scaffold76255_cov56-Attheya_sp.AAC.2
MTKYSVTSGSGSAMMVVTAIMWMLAWSSVDAFHSLALLHAPHRAATSCTRITMTASDNPYTPEKLAGKTVLQRRLHILPTSITTPVSSLEGLYTLEERVRYQYPDVVDPQNPNVNPNPVGWHTFILRAPPSSLTNDNDDDGVLEPPSDSPTWLRLGPEVYRMDVHEAKVNSEKQTHHSGLGGQAWDTGAAMALYCAAHPSLFRECKKALELSCGSGFAGIMSTVAAGAAFWGVGTDQEEDIAAQYFASLEQEDEPSEPAPAFLSIEDIASSTPPTKKTNNANDDDDDVVNDAFPHHSRVPLPPVFKSLTMADESEDVLQQ